MSETELKPCPFCGSAAGEAAWPRPRIVHEMVSAQTVEGSERRFWGNFGYAHGPGFQAFCDDFPVGTTLRITAEIVLPGAEGGGA